MMDSSPFLHGLQGRFYWSIFSQFPRVAFSDIVLETYTWISCSLAVSHFAPSISRLAVVVVVVVMEWMGECLLPGSLTGAKSHRVPSVAWKESQEMGLDRESSGERS